MTKDRGTTGTVTPQPPGRTPHSTGRRAFGTTQPQAPLRCSGGEDTPSEASEAPARKAKRAGAVRPSSLDPAIAARLKRDANGLVAAIAQQYDTGEVLMLAWMDDEALHRTLSTGRCTYWSRSRGQYWVKGESSGHVQRVISVALDCDGDAVLVKVDQSGGACHTGDRTCFGAGALELTAP
jgi:phosphoribosyl-AMP cyclohydrolase